MDHFLVSALLIVDLIYGLFYFNFYLFNQNWFLLIIAYLWSVILYFILADRPRRYWSMVLILSAASVSLLGETYFLDVALRSLELLPRHFIDP